MSNKLPALWTAEDDFTLVMTLAHQKLAGNAYKTAGHAKPIRPSSTKLEGSEKITGGATKTCRWSKAVGNGRVISPS
jgi:hypothetical protein